MTWNAISLGVRDRSRSFDDPCTGVSILHQILPGWREKSRESETIESGSLGRLIVAGVQ